MSYELLKKQLKNGEIQGAYHFYGEENYLKNYYLKEIKSKIIDEALEGFNYTVYEGTSVSPQTFSESVETPPLMGEKKLIVLKDTDVFTLSTKAKEGWVKVFSDLPEYVCVIACEENFDKRSSVYKAFGSKCLSVNFSYRPRGDIKAWVTKILGKNGKSIDNKDMDYLLDAVGVDMYGVLSQLEKLISYTGHRNRITKEDIDSLIVKELSSKEYMLTDALISKNKSDSFSVLRELWGMREEPVKLLYVIASSFITVARAKELLQDGATGNEITRELSLPFDFLAKKAIENAKKGSQGFFDNAISLIRDSDYRIKLGLSEPYAEIESLCASIVEYKD